MKALTLWQPWASAVALDQKKIETRSWSTNYRGPLAIHASKRWHGNEAGFFADIISGLLLSHQFDIWQGYCEADYNKLPFGEIIATCRLVDCVEIRPGTAVSDDERKWGDYRTGRFMWILEDVLRLRVGVPVNGRQGLWNWEGSR